MWLSIDSLFFLRNPIILFVIQWICHEIWPTVLKDCIFMHAWMLYLVSVMLNNMKFYRSCIDWILEMIFLGFQPSMAFFKGGDVRPSEHSVAGWGNTQARGNHATTAVGEHIGMKGHKITEEEVIVLARESYTWQRKMKEAVEIRTHQPEMNRDIMDTTSQP